jgi:hypothetical protein
VIPGGVLLCQTHHEVTDLVTDGWVTGTGWGRSTFL